MSNTARGHGRIDMRTIHVSDEIADCPRWLEVRSARDVAQLNRGATDKKTGGQKKAWTVSVLTSVRSNQATNQEVIRLARAF